MKTITFAFNIYKKYRLGVIILMLVYTLSIVISFFIPKIIQYIIDYCFMSPDIMPETNLFLKIFTNSDVHIIGSESLFRILCIYLIVFYFLKSLLFYLKDIGFLKVKNNMEYAIKESLLEKVRKTKKVNKDEFFIIYKQDSESVGTLFCDDIPSFLADIFSFILGVVMLATINYIFFIIPVFAIMLYTLLNFIFIKKTSGVAVIEHKKRMNFVSIIDENVFRITKNFDTGTTKLGHKLNDVFLDLTRDKSFLDDRFNFYFNLIQISSFLGSIALGLYFGIMRIISLGEFLIVYAYISLLLSSTASFIFKTNRVNLAMTRINRIKKFFLMPVQPSAGKVTVGVMGLPAERSGQEEGAGIMIGGRVVNWGEKKETDKLRKKIKVAEKVDTKQGVKTTEKKPNAEDKK